MCTSRRCSGTSIAVRVEHQHPGDDLISDRVRAATRSVVANIAAGDGATIEVRVAGGADLALEDALITRRQHRIPADTA